MIAGNRKFTKNSRMAFMKLFAILILFQIMMMGCATSGKYEISRPTIGDKSGRYKYNRISKWDQKINLSGIDLFVEPQNDWIAWKYFAITIIPVWFSKDKSVMDEGTPFRFDLAFLPHEDDFSFDPMKVSLQVDGVSDIKPNRVNGPMPKYHHGGFYPDEWENEALSGGRVLCGGGSTDARPEYPILLKKESLWTCLQLEFDIPILSPKQNISLKIYGLTKDNQHIEIPTIVFEKLEEARGDSIP